MFLKDVRLVVEDIGNQHEKSEFGFRIKEELQKEKKRNAEKHFIGSKAR